MVDECGGGRKQPAAPPACARRRTRPPCRAARGRAWCWM